MTPPRQSWVTAPLAPTDDDRRAPWEVPLSRWTANDPRPPARRGVLELARILNEIFRGRWR